MQYKKIIVRIIFISALVAGTMDIVNIQPAEALVSMLVLYFVIPLVSLSLTDSTKVQIKIGGIIATIIILALSRFTIYPLIGAAIFVGGTLYSILQHNILLHRRKKVTTWGLAIIHSAVFCMVCAVAGSFSIMGRGNNLNLQCDKVRGFVNQYMGTVLTPLRFTSEQIDNIQLWVDGFFTKSTEEVIQEQVMNQLGGGGDMNIPGELGGKSVAEITKMMESNPQIKQLLGGKSASDVAALLKKNANTLVIQSPNPNTLASKNPVAQKLLAKTQNKGITTTVEDKQELDNKICNVIFDQINTRSAKKGFALSILVSLIFFFYPLIRLFAYIYAYILAVVYTILKKAGFISVIPEEKIVDTWMVGDGYVGNTILSTLAIKGGKKQSPSQIAAQNAIPPKTSSKNSGSSNIDDMLEGIGGGSGGDENHIVTANSPQDNDPSDIPPAPKKDSGPHIDFGSFGGNFDKKPERR